MTTPRPSNRDLAALFDEIGDLLEIRGENPFKVRAYRRAAETIAALPTPAADLDAAALRATPNIGDALADKIVERVTTGRLAFLERLYQSVPPTARELVRVPGVGPKTAGKLVAAGIADRAALEAAAADGRLATVVGKTAADRIVRGLAAVEPQSDRVDRERAASALRAARAVAETLPSVRRVEVAGSVRRGAERVGDVNLAVAADDPDAAQRAFADALPGGALVAPLGASATIDGVVVRVRFAPPDAFGSLWQWWTGSVAHNEALAARAGDHGVTLGAFGLRPTDSSGFATEEALYAALGLAWIPPELREGAAELDAAAAGTLPALVGLADIRGDLHLHTDWSDGADTLETMVAAARARGYDYVAITDHSVGRSVANGLTVDRLRRQIERVRAYNDAHPDGPQVLAGAEVDIKADGSLDYPDSALAELDLVIASVHSALDQPREQMTARLKAAAANPYVTCLGHLTGRLIGKRDPVDADIEAVLAVAADHDVWVEINAHPARLDLREEHVRIAKARGAPIVINTDSHAADQLALMAYGVGVARRAWLEPRDVVNTLPRDAFLARLQGRRRRR
ncbi:MAG: DNA polymerase/3'-5' exonuclease PolX [Dehalococcoidia bacterium]|nr:DNA polymerase/3'-5' exonuclease PolX [Dehalococcoidia bacterium]